MAHVSEVQQQYKDMGVTVIAVDVMETDLDAAPALIKKMGMTAYANAVLREEKAQVRKQLLLLAVQVQRDGPEAIKDSTVPNHGPVEYSQTDSGFELRCKPKSAAESVVLQVLTH